jgi:hypothetical protein
MTRSSSLVLLLLLAACSDSVGPPRISALLQATREGDYCRRVWTATATVEADYQYEVQAPGGGVGNPTWAGFFRRSVSREDLMWIGPNSTGFLYSARVWGNGITYEDTRMVTC